MKKVAIIDDHVMFLEMLGEYFGDSEAYEVVHTQNTTEGLLDPLQAHKPDLLLSDMMLPGPSIFQTIPQLLKALPKLKVLVMSGMFNETNTKMLHQIGAHGIVSKMHSIDEIAKAVDAVLNGQIYYPQDLLDQIKENPDGVGPKVSKREIEIMRLISQGLSEKQIAAELNIAENTVNNHKANIFSKLGVQNQVSMVVEGIRRGLIPNPGIESEE